MKKIAILFVVIALLLLSGCRKSNELFDISYEATYSENLKFVTEKEKYSIEDTTICFTITNVSSQEQSIAADSGCFSLEKLENDEWKRVGTKIEHAWNSLALILPPGGTEEREIKLDKYFYLPLEKGEYRITVEYIASNKFEVF